MNKSANKFGCGTLCFYFIKLYSTCASDSMPHLRRQINVRTAAISSFYCENCFDRGVNLSNFGICVYEWPLGVDFL